MSPKLKRILLITGGALLVLVSLFMLATFIYACDHDVGLPEFTSEKRLVSAPFIVFMWICILGTGLPAGLLLLWGIRGGREKEDEAVVGADGSGEVEVY